MGNLSPTGCADLRVGENCTETWNDALAPASLNLTYTLLFFFSLVLVLLAKIYIETLIRSSASYKSKKSRLHLLVYSKVSVVGYIIFYSFNGNLVYQMDTPEGKICVSSLLIGNVFFLHTVGKVVLMYIRTLSNSIRRNESFFEKLDLKTLELFTSPWLLHLVNLVVITMLVFELFPAKLTALVVIKIMYAASLFSLITLTYLGFYYFRKLAVNIEKMISVLLRISAESVAAHGDAHIQLFKKTASRSRLLAYYHIVVGNASVLLCLVALCINLIDVPVYFFGFQSFFSTGICAYYYIVILLLEKGQLSDLTSSRKASEGLQTPIKLNASISSALREDNSRSDFLSSRGKVVDSMI